MCLLRSKRFARQRSCCTLTATSEGPAPEIADAEQLLLLEEGSGRRAAANVSLLRCFRKLALRCLEGEANAALALALLAGFGLLLPALDAVALVIAALQIYFRDARGVPELAEPCTGLVISRALRKIAMLDVMVVGIAILVASSSAFPPGNITLSFCGGFYALFSAEVCRYSSMVLVEGMTPQDGETRAVARSDVVASAPSGQV